MKQNLSQLKRSSVRDLSLPPYSALPLKHKILFLLWNNIHFAPRFIIKRWQEYQLRRIANTAYNYVPIYRKLWDEHGINPQLVEVLEDIKLLPIIKKSDFHGREENEICHAYYKSMPYKKWKTSGSSTGMTFWYLTDNPYYLRIRHSDHLYAISLAYRFLLDRGFPISFFWDKCRAVKISVFNGAKDERNYTHIKVSLDQGLESALRKIRKFGPHIVEGAPSMLCNLADTAQELAPVDRFKFPFVISSSEMLSREQRIQIENTFETEVYDAYGLSEVLTVAMECRQHDGMHIFEESFMVEIVDDRDKPVADGNSGRIVVTHFYNKVMPFIRYDTGDLGMIIPDSCTCGIPARRIRIEGRKLGYFSFGNRKVHPFECENIFYFHQKTVKYYQLVKKQNGNLEIRIVPFKSPAEIDLSYIQKQFQNKFGLSPKVSFVAEEDFRIGIMGKLPPLYVEES